MYFLAIAVRAQQYVSNRMQAGCIELLTETLEWFRYLLTLTTSALGQLLLALLHSQGGLCAKVMTAFLNEGKLMGYSEDAFACMLSVLVVDSSWSMLSSLLNLVVWAAKPTRKATSCQTNNQPTEPGVSRQVLPWSPHRSSRDIPPQPWR